jgi:hypothetical protein
MNVAQIKCLAVFSIFAIIGFGPFSPGCLIGMYVVLIRPIWFWNLIGNLYNNPKPYQLSFPIESKKARKKTFLFLLCLFVVDIAPVPVTPVIAFLIILSKPLWFYLNVQNIYGNKFKI